VDQVTLRFSADLDDFLPPNRRGRAFTLAIANPRSVKDLVEALGVPHTEAGAILLNGVSVSFAHPVRAGDEIAVYSPAALPDLPDLPPVAPLIRLQPAPPAPRFVLDVHLGRLAAYLRMLGFDTLYSNDCDDDVLAAISARERRILLSRDVGLLKRGNVCYGAFVHATAPEAQLIEISRRFDLAAALDPFARCIRCNGPLIPVAKVDVLDRLPERVREQYDEFRRCAACDQVYWRGTHFQRMARLVERLRQSTGGV
jgi:uncharacterized protein